MVALRRPPSLHQQHCQQRDATLFDLSACSASFVLCRSLFQPFRLKVETVLLKDSRCLRSVPFGATSNHMMGVAPFSGADDSAAKRTCCTHMHLVAQAGSVPQRAQVKSDQASHYCKGLTQELTQPPPRTGFESYSAKLPVTIDFEA